MAVAGGDEGAILLTWFALDAWTHVGDYIYEYGASGYAMGGWSFSGRNATPGSSAFYSPPHEILRIDDYRLRHKQYLTDPNLMRLRAAGVNVGQVVDDHETANNAWAGGAENHGNATSSVEDGVTWAARKAAGMQAWREYIPTRKGARSTDGGRTVGYRRFAFGGLMEVVSMDTRNGTAFHRADDIWALHNPSIFLNNGNFTSPFTDQTRLPGFLAVRAQMVALQEQVGQVQEGQQGEISSRLR
jgi:phosphodiesterase/alkaline phosphatase D-like protein